MRSIKETKKQARQTLKKNYWRCVAIAFFISIILGSYKITETNYIGKKSNTFTIQQEHFTTSINSEIVNDTLEAIGNINTSISSYKPTRGVLANVFNNITSSGNFIFGLLNSFNQLIFHERVWASIIILLGAILTFLYWLFIQNVLRVGEARFFLENRNYKKTNFHRLLFPYKVKQEKNISMAMMRKTLQEWLWFLTIIGGIIKHYSYSLVPYILAENPGIKGKEAIKLSRDMMQGQKWFLFKLDISLIGWYILDILSFHLIGIIFTTPYKKCCKAEFYMQVRHDAKEKEIANVTFLKDIYLEKTGELYPSEKGLFKETETKKWLHTNYNKTYSAISLILMFFVASIAGWIWEVGLHLFQYGAFVNRGSLHGPWLPIYGWGLILLLILLKKFRNNPIITFLLAIIVCGTIEYTTGWYLETFKNLRYWDYDGFFLNLHGRICLEGLIVFGLGGCAFIYFAAPFLDSIFENIKPPIKMSFCIAFTLLFVIDSIYSNHFPNTGEGVSQNFQIEKENTMVFKL